MSHKIKPDSPLATGKLPTGEQIAFDLLPDEDRDSFMREMLAADTDPNYSESVALQNPFAESDRLGITHEGDEPPLVAGGYIDDQSKWYDGTGEWLLYLTGFLSGGLVTWLIIYAVGRFL
jgi:hypothetical protein